MKQDSQRNRKQGRNGARKTALAVAALAALGHGYAWAQAAFELGAVTVVGQRAQAGEVAEVGEVGDHQVASVLTRQDMRKFNRDNVGDALNLLSGVSLSTNARNEKTIAVRGFDARQVPLFIDGIPVYVPYDGYVDFNRFTTADLAAIQVAKGFSSVAYGANALGGAINLISRKPLRRLEADATAGAADGRERQVSANLGSNQGLWYVQAGVSYLEGDGFPLSADVARSASEDGGQRNNAYRKDGKLSFKLGLTPNGRDEYALSYYRQDGEKGQPPSTDAAAARYWKWPFWDKESLYFISKTALGAVELLQLRLYHDSYDNEVDTYTNGAYTRLKTAGAGSVGTGRSIYHDRTVGGSITLESARWQAHTLRLVAHYKADKHQELDGNGVGNTVFEDGLLSYALEDTVELAPAWTLSLGAARHQLKPASVYSLGNPYALPGTQHANNAQAGLFHDWAGAGRVYANVAGKTRMPTLKDRYSQRLGTYIENPALRAERSLNYEIGYQGRAWAGVKAEAAVFYSDISDKIQPVAHVAGAKSQMRNVGRVRASGLELGLNGRAAAWLEWGGNVTLTELKNLGAPTLKLTDVPKRKLTAHLLLRPADAVELLAFAEHDSGRWVSNTLALPGFTTLNVKAAYKPTARVTLEAGVNNATDRNYALADGFPSPGRLWFANIRYQL
ncbi:iron complex outermembrane recepter protein [Janthinobacterium sp. CG_23.3]